ncbi:MAG TPA: glycoside hydrolase family 2 TIM barrel-domain containing protein [Terriglobia bacterium]|nr:glycoside hydrolase family 2 TIM barrel-domain containing protein [Terriglobia bacterium]
MISRREFVTTLGASTLLSGTPSLRAQAAGTESAQSGRSRINLNGEWERYIAEDLYDVVQVPSSLRPSGLYRLKREFLLPRLNSSQRAFAHFEAINYFGRVSVNGRELGTTIPYVPFDFEFTRDAKEGRNAIEASIRDLGTDPSGAGRDEIALGVNPGWEAYGGIIRDAYVEVRPAAFIENLRFGYKLSSDYSRASCSLQVDLSSTTETQGELQVELWHGAAEVAGVKKTLTVSAGASQSELSFDLMHPALWSPEEPNLYELKAAFTSSHGEDHWSCHTGFRDAVARGPEFLLNGKRLILNGVCRHDMWREQGFTMTRQQMEQDMRMIKMLGCNFVRLVHYPHHRYIVELADELGLLVSEEPGYWNMDFSKMPQSMIELGYAIMEKVIRRDWNSPSVFAWLLSNECTLTVESLRKGKELCNRLDPIGRFVSAANSMPKEKAKPIFEQAGMDFFDQHPYTYNLDEFNAEAEYDGPGKPLTFTEWGGKAIGQSQIVMQNSVDRMLDLIEARQLAGHVFWSWQDMRQYSRIDGEMRNGVLESGVVTEGREPRDVVYLELARLFEGRRHDTELPDSRPQVVPLKRIPWSRGSRFQPLDLQSISEMPERTKAWASLEKSLAEYWPKVPYARDQWKRTGGKFLLWRGSEVDIAGVPFHFPVMSGYVRPLVLTPDSPEVSIPVDSQCLRLHVLGHVTLPDGYPTLGTAGQTVATYALRPQSGKVREIPIRNSHEVVRANLVQVATRISPQATEAQRALLFLKDLAREHYQILLYSIPGSGEKLVSLSCRLNGQQPPLAIFAVTAELA